MFGKLLSFLVGVYAGIYIDQHYQVPSIENPQELWAKVKEYASQFEKKTPGGSGPSQDS